jgi:Tfp pilus assembly protein PilX
MLNQRGMALPVTLIVMVAIGGLTLGLLTLSSVEPRVSKNLEEATQARFAAEAGLEWGYNFLAQNTTTWSTSLASATASTGATLVAGQAIGTLNAARGTYTVVLRNDHRNNDNLLTGVSPIEGSHNADGNGVVILTATGGIGNATKTLRAVVKRTQFPNGFFPGALNFPGNEAEVTFSGGTFNIDGRGYHTDGTLDAGCASAYGIAVSSVLPSSNPGANEAAVEGKLASTQQDNVKGKAQDPNQTAEGNNTIVANPVLTPAYINQFIDQAKASADLTLTSHQPSGLSFDAIGGSTCTSNWASQNCWGTADNPKTIWIKGDADPTSMFSALTLNGPTTGYGVLIVEDGDFRIYGDFTWHGAIIVTGNWVGVGFLGGGTQTVYGAVISNETSTDPGFKEGVVTGNAKIRYSCDALNNSLNNPKLVKLTNWKDLAPGE